MLKTETRVTIVVLTCNRRREVLRTLDGLRELEGHPAIVVVDNGSNDGTADAIRYRFPDVELVALPENLGAAGRNAGAAKARTPYVAFSDDDTIWEPDAPRIAADILDAHPDVGVISAHILVGNEGRDDPACEPMKHSPLDSDGAPGKCILGFMAGACVIRREAFQAAGGYVPRLFIGGEEALLSLDLATLGWRMVYCPQVITRHYPSPLRNVRTRRGLLARNAIWTAWMRLPFLDAMRETRKVLADMARQHFLCRGLWQTLKGLPAILGARRVVPPHVRAMWQATHQR